MHSQSAALMIMSWTDEITTGRPCWNLFKSSAVRYGYARYFLFYNVADAYPSRIITEFLDIFGFVQLVEFNKDVR
jgi:hypothetical protein